MSADAFWKWFSREQPHLRRLDPEQLAESLEQQLHQQVGELGVEVAAEEGAPLEVVFTAGGDAERFGTVKQLVAAAPAVDGWTFVALKPAMGFDFTLEAGGVELEASSLRFEPLEGPQGPGVLGLRVFLPEEAARDEEVEELLWLLLHTGVGEEDAARIAHVEAAPLSSPDAKEALPLPELGAYLTWHRERHG